MLFQLVTAAAAWLVLLLLGGDALSMAWGGRLAFQTFGWRFVTSTRLGRASAAKFGALVPIYGTLVTSAIALIIAVPVSIGIALVPDRHRAALEPRRRSRIAIELLAAIPSIIYGMWGLFVFAPFMADACRAVAQRSSRQQGRSSARCSPDRRSASACSPPASCSGSWSSRSSHRSRAKCSAPSRRRCKESAVALGSTRWEVLSRVTLPYTRSAIIGAIFLGLGRALGETMAVTFVLGNAHDLSASLLMPSNSIAAAIANEFTEADTELYRSSLIALGFLLFVVTFIVLTIAKLLLMRLNRQLGKDALMADPRAPPRRRCRRLRLRRRLATVFGLFWLAWILWTTLARAPRR